GRQALGLEQPEIRMVALHHPVAGWAASARETALHRRLAEQGLREGPAQRIRADPFGAPKQERVRQLDAVAAELFPGRSLPRINHYLQISETMSSSSFLTSAGARSPSTMRIR